MTGSGNTNRWSDHFSASCPPESANSMDIFPVYRITLNDPPLDEDFLSHKESQRGYPPEKECGACAVSVFTDIEQIQRAKRRIAIFKNRGYIVEGELPRNLGLFPSRTISPISTGGSIKGSILKSTLKVIPKLGMVNMDYTLPFPIGAVKVIHLIEYYDGPKVFVCENITGQKYVVNWTDTSSTSDTWFYVPVSGTRYLEMLNGRVSLRDCILKSEANTVLVVRTPKGQNQSVEIEYKDAGSIREEELPDIDSYLDSDQQYPTLPSREESTVLSASRSGRDVLDLSLNVRDQHSNEIDAELLGEVLVATQNLAYQLGSNSISSRGPIAKEVMNANKLKTSGFFAASFGVRLMSATSQGLLGDTEASDSLEKLLTLFEATPEEERFRTTLEGLSIRTIKAYYNLLNKLDNEDTKINVEWASPNKKYRSALLDSGNIKKAIDILIKESKTETKQMEIRGILVGVQTETNKFNLQVDREEVISGVIGEGLRNRQFTVPAKVKAVVEQKIEVQVFNEEEKSTYTLLSLG